MTRELDERCINTLRFLSVDMVQKAIRAKPSEMFVAKEGELR